MPRPLKQQVVGEHVRQLRGQVGLSLRSLARRTDFSPSFISQLENGQVSPSIGSMEKIANALGVTLAEFFGGIEPGETGAIVRVADRKRVPSGWSHGEVETLSPMGVNGRRLDVLLVTLKPGGRSSKHPAAHKNEEFALVLEGHPTVRLGPDEHTLGPGDAVTILRQELRSWANPGSDLARILIVSPRSRAR